MALGQDPLRVPSDVSSDPALLHPVREQLRLINPTLAADTVLSEYVLVLVANRKSAGQVEDDLRAFLREESHAFVSWLWQTVSSHYAKRRSTSPPLESSKEEDKEGFQERGSATLQGEVVCVGPAVATSSHPAVSAFPPTNTRLLIKAVDDAARASEGGEEPSHSERTTTTAFTTAERHTGGPSSEVSRPVRPGFLDRMEEEEEEEEEVDVDDGGDDDDDDEGEEGNDGEQQREDVPHKRVVHTTRSRKKTRGAGRRGVTFTVVMKRGKNRPPVKALDRNRHTRRIPKAKEGERVLRAVRCRYWPNCEKGDACPFHHPSQICTYWPTCPFGNECLFIHPSLPCRYGTECCRPNCAYNHPNRGSFSQSAESSLTSFDPPIPFPNITWRRV